MAVFGGFVRLFARKENKRPQAAMSPPKKAGLAAVVGTSAAAVLVATVVQWEGVRYVPYRDVIGKLTVCVGDTYDVKEGLTYSKAECEERLERQLIAHARPVIECVPGLTRRPNTTAAAVSLAYNIGTNGFCRSTVAKRFNQGRWAEGCDAFMLWNRAGGREVKGLTRRRQAEREICRRDLA